MSDVHCMLCVWLSEQPPALQIFAGVIFLVILVPAVLWALAVLTPRLDQELERRLADGVQLQPAVPEPRAIEPSRTGLRPTIKLGLVRETKMDLQSRRMSQ